MNTKLSVFLLFFFLSSPTFADEVLTLDLIQVRGNKEEKSYSETPDSISILQENELPAAGRENNIQVLNAVPNVEVNKNGDSFSIRGINNTGVTGFQKDNLSSVIIDDLFQTDLGIQASSFDIWDLDRIEVQRGTQSTNQGVNSLAGSILLDHHHPHFSTEGAAKFGVGNFGNREAGIVTNNILIKNKLASRISYDKEMNNGYIKNIATGNDKWGEWSKDRAKAELLYHFSDSETLSLKGKFNQNVQGGTYVQGNDVLAHEVNENQDNHTKTQNFQLIANYSRTITPEIKNVTILGLSKSDQNSTSDADGTPNDTAGTRNEIHGDHYYSVENRIYYQTRKASNLLGIQAHDFKLTDDYDFNLLFPLSAGRSTPIAVKQGVDRTRSAYSIFDSLTYRFTEQHALVAGARAEYVEARYGTNVSGARLQDLGNATNTAVSTYLSQISGNYEGRKSNAVLLPKVGYLFSTGNHHAGITYTRGYRTAGVSINRRRATAVDYDPEFTNNYEMSYKYSDRALQLGANLFYIDWRAQQVQVQLSNDFYDTQVQNAAKSEVYGTELEGRLKLSQNQLGIGVGYSDTKFKEFETRNGSYAGKKFPFASNWTGRISHEFKWRENLSFLTVLRYLSDSYVNPENTRKADRQFYLNIGTKYSFRSFILEGYINNVLDGQYRIFDGTPTSVSATYQASYHQTNTPREFGARLSYYW